MGHGSGTRLMDLQVVKGQRRWPFSNFNANKVTEPIHSKVTVICHSYKVTIRIMNTEVGLVSGRSLSVLKVFVMLYVLIFA